MKRTDLLLYRRTLLTEDTADAVRRLELSAAKIPGVRLTVQGPEASQFRWGEPRGPSACADHISMRPTGRELYLSLTLPDMSGDSEEKQRECLAVLWGIAIPCGFIPWNRNPLPGHGDQLFHYPGPWQSLYDSLLGEGRGEAAWASYACAAQVDVGKWEGEREVERFVQAQLHRLGMACGPVDGQIGERTTQAMHALGLPQEGSSLSETATYLATLDPPEAAQTSRTHGFISVPDPNAVAVSTGKVSIQKTPAGFALTVDGPGRVILDLG